MTRRHVILDIAAKGLDPSKPHAKLHKTGLRGPVVASAPAKEEKVEAKVEEPKVEEPEVDDKANAKKAKESAKKETSSKKASRAAKAKNGFKELVSKAKKDLTGADD